MARFEKGKKYDDGVYLGERLDTEGLVHVFVNDDEEETLLPFNDAEKQAAKPEWMAEEEE